MDYSPTTPAIYTASPNLTAASQNEEAFYEWIRKLKRDGSELPPIFPKIAFGVIRGDILPIKSDAEGSRLVWNAMWLVRNYYDGVVRTLCWK